jgi:hypothetical protein
MAHSRLISADASSFAAKAPRQTVCRVPPPPGSASHWQASSAVMVAFQARTQRLVCFAKIWEPADGQNRALRLASVSLIGGGQPSTSRGQSSTSRGGSPGARSLSAKRRRISSVMYGLFGPAHCPFRLASTLASRPRRLFVVTEFSPPPVPGLSIAPQTQTIRASLRKLRRAGLSRSLQSASILPPPPRPRLRP